MPTYDEAVDAALVATSHGRAAERAALDALVEGFPGRPGGPALEVLAALWRGDLEEAEERAAKLGDEPAELAVRAEIEAFVGDTEAAKLHIEAALVAAPDDPIVLRCAHSIFGIDQPEKSLEVARRRVALRPHDPNAYGSLGTTLLHADPEEAERLAENPPPAFAESHLLWTLRARLAIKRRDLPLAESHARAAVAANSDSHMAWTTLADVLRYQGKKAEAGEAAKFSLELNRRNPLAMRVLGALATARGDKAEAERWEREAQAAIPGLAHMAVLRQVNQMVSQGKREEALAELRKLDGRRGATLSAVRHIRVQILINLKDDAALLAEADAMEREGMVGGTLVRARAELDRRAGRMAEARQRLEKGLADGFTEMIAPLVEVLAQQGDLDEVRRIVAEVPGTPANAAEAYMQLQKAGLKEEARAFLEAARRQYPEAQLLQVIRVGALAQDGNLQGAFTAMRDLDDEHRMKIPIRISFRTLLKLILRRMFRRKKV